jgi:MFS family permease
VVAAGAVGTLLAAAVTPWAVRHVGKPRWITALLTGGGLAQLVLGLPFLPGTTVLAWFALGFMAQAVKICVDTTLQESVDDDFRGRVFSVYDTLVNVTFVLAVLVGAFVLPPSGVSYPVLVGVGAGYVATAVAYARITRRH